MVPQWRAIGYIGSKNKNVANADLFNRLDMIISYYQLYDGLSVSVGRIAREANSTAIAMFLEAPTSKCRTRMDRRNCL